MTNYIKYGTDDGVEIWLLRYGFEFEDFDWLIPLVDSVDEKEIKFKNLPKLSEDQYDRIKKFI
jgi:ATP-dependent RNA helicase DOB1